MGYRLKNGMILSRRSSRRRTTYTVQVFSVVVVAPVRHYLTYTEVLNELMEAPDARSALSHRKLMSNLIAGSVADSALPVWLPDEAD
jgi:hypothetical protein